MSEDTTTLIAAMIFWLAPCVLCALKGKYGFAAVGLFVHIFALVGMIRLAKPKSLWARKWYNADMRARAAERFAKPAATR